MSGIAAWYQARQAVIDAAIAWVDRIVDHPNSWADDEDAALIEAVKRLRRTAS